MTISYFTVQAAFEAIDTNQVQGGNNVPTIEYPSGTVTFTPNLEQVEMSPDIVFMTPIVGRFSSTMNSGTYTTTGTGDTTFAQIAAIIGGASVTAASLQAANSSVTSPIAAHTVITIPAGNDGALRTLNGSLGVELVDNVGLGLTQGELTYRVDYSNAVFNDIANQPISPVRIAAPGNGAIIDLSNPANWITV
jgi:hypothetical protein